MPQYRLSGGDGVSLYVQETGPADGPAIVFIHGFAQSQAAWHRQFEGELARTCRVVAFDLRGHGLSDKPTHAAAYRDSRLWADDLAAVMAELKLVRPVLVGWSYGGYVICDYVRHYGTTGLSGVCFMGAATKMGTPEAATGLGTEFSSRIPDMLSTDFVTNVTTMAEFFHICTRIDPGPTELYLALGYNSLVPPTVRRALFTRKLENDDLLAALDLPCLIVHGSEDQVILPSVARHHAAIIPQARLSFYEGVGHMPCIEASERFDAELADFARQCAVK